MSNEVKMVGYKATIQEYEELKSQANARGVSLSALLRLAVREFLNGADLKLEDKSDNDRIALEKQLERADSEIQHLRDQLVRRDEQIDHLTQLLAMQTKTTAMLTERLQAIEDMRHRNWWKRLLRR